MAASARGPRHPLAETAVHRAIRRRLRTCGRYDERPSKSYIAFRRARGFAYLWTARDWIGDRAAPAVLSIALPRRLRSARFKQVVHPSPGIWMHHLELRRASDVDDEVGLWLRAAYDAAGPRSGRSAATGSSGAGSPRRGSGSPSSH